MIVPQIIKLLTTSKHKQQPNNKTKQDIAHGDAVNEQQHSNPYIFIIESNKLTMLIRLEGKFLSF